MAGINWLSWVVKIVQAAPAAVIATEAVAGQAKSGADKKTLAMSSLGFADEIAGMIDPNYKASYDAAAQLASSVIDGVVSVANAAPGGKLNQAAAASVLASNTLPQVAQTVATIQQNAASA
jgi:hypothetical protein